MYRSRGRVDGGFLGSRRREKAVDINHQICRIGREKAYRTTVSRRHDGGIGQYCAIKRVQRRYERLRLSGWPGGQIRKRSCGTTVAFKAYAAALAVLHRELDGIGKDRLVPPSIEGAAKSTGRIPGVQNLARLHGIELEQVEWEGRSSR